jgi:acetyltransferase-like isoleucine patch superfamily enzyme
MNYIIRLILYFLRLIWHTLYLFYLRVKFYNVSLGKNVAINGHVEFHNSGKTIIGNGSRIRKWVVLNPYGGEIFIGENCSINSFCHISGNGRVRIGNNVLIASNCTIISANHNFDRIDLPIYMQGETRKPIIIEEDCWIGSGCRILAGVTIGKGSVVGAGSVVTKDIPPFSISVGVPARVIRIRKNISS